MPSKFRAEANGAVPSITKLNTGLPQSLLLIFTAALLVPLAVGVKATTNEVVPLAASEEAGKVVTENSEAFKPVKYGMPTCMIPVPVLAITKVPVVAPLKFVRFR